MTNTAYILTTDARAQSDLTSFIMDTMSGYDTDLYRTEIAAGKLDELADEEMANVWTQGDDTFPTEAAARAEADERYDDGRGHYYVVEIATSDIRDALKRNFGR